MIPAVLIIIKSICRRFKCKHESLIYSKLEQPNPTDFELQSPKMCLAFLSTTYSIRLFYGLFCSKFVLVIWLISYILGIRGPDQVWCQHRANKSTSHKKDVDVPRSQLTSQRLSFVCCRRGTSACCVLQWRKGGRERERETGGGGVWALSIGSVDTLRFVYTFPTIQMMKFVEGLTLCRID